jgi:hypothetical protein
VYNVTCMITATYHHAVCTNVHYEIVKRKI